MKRPPQPLKCKHCKVLTTNRIDNVVLCSQKCKILYRRKFVRKYNNVPTQITCQNCGKLVKRRIDQVIHLKKYCSFKCYNEETIKQRWVNNKLTIERKKAINAEYNSASESEKDDILEAMRVKIMSGD